MLSFITLLLQKNVLTTEIRWETLQELFLTFHQLSLRNFCCL